MMLQLAFKWFSKDQKKKKKQQTNNKGLCVFLYIRVLRENAMLMLTIIMSEGCTGVRCIILPIFLVI
jgi:hypothetical protein